MGGNGGRGVATRARLAESPRAFGRALARADRNRARRGGGPARAGTNIAAVQRLGGLSARQRRLNARARARQRR